MSEHLMEPDPRPERFDDYRDVGTYLRAEENFAWITRVADHLLDRIEREGEVSDEELLQSIPFPPDYADETAFDSRQIVPTFYEEVAPVLSTNDRVEWLNAWRLTEDAPEPGSDAFDEATESISIPRGTRSSNRSAFSTEVYAGFIERAYATLYKLVTEDDRPVSGYELYRAHPTFEFNPKQYREVMGYFAQIEGVIPPQGRDDYDLSVMAWNTDLYAQAVDEGYVTDDEVAWLLDEARDQPAAWRYVGDSKTVEADAEADAELESYA